MLSYFGEMPDMLNHERIQSCHGPKDYGRSPQNLIELTRGTGILTAVAIASVVMEKRLSRDWNHRTAAQSGRSYAKQHPVIDR
jgi:hypothetical protein